MTKEGTHKASMLVLTELWSSRTTPSPTSIKASLWGVWHWSSLEFSQTSKQENGPRKFETQVPPIPNSLPNNVIFRATFLVCGWSYKVSSRTWTLKRVSLEPRIHETHLTRISFGWLLTPKFSRWEALRRPRSLNISTRRFPLDGQEKNYLLWFADLNRIQKTQKFSTYIIGYSLISFFFFLEIHRTTRTEEHHASPLRGLLSESSFGRPDLGPIRMSVMRVWWSYLLGKEGRRGRRWVIFCIPPDRCQSLAVRWTDCDICYVRFQYSPLSSILASVWVYRKHTDLTLRRF